MGDVGVTLYERTERANRECMDKLHDTIANLHDELADARYLIGKLKSQLSTRTFIARQFVHNINDGIVTANNEDPFVAMFERDVDRWARWDKEDGV